MCKGYFARQATNDALARVSEGYMESEDGELWRGGGGDWNEMIFPRRYVCMYESWGVFIRCIATLV